MEIGCEILGPLVVRVDGRQVRLGGIKEQSVLVLLVLRAGEVVSSDFLIDQLWGDHPPPSAANTLQTYISRLRKSLHGPETEVLLTRRPGYVLEIEHEAIDARRFERLLRSGQKALAAGGAAAQAASTLREALALWRGPALADFATEEFASAEIRRLDEMRLTAVEARIRADLDLGNHREVIPEAEQLVAQHPLREGLWASLMLALYRDGRQADALRAFQTARKYLAEELGIDPGPDLQRLEQSVLQQDSSLLAEPVAGREPPPWSGNLPADITSFVGRVGELEELEALAQRSRVLTLLGPGGIGKSRLAVELARRLAPTLADGAWLVDLGTATNRASLISEIAALWPQGDTTAGATLEEVGTLLRDRRAMLLLDNCERMVAEVAPLAEQLLAVAPSLQILATSREPLECRGEVLWRVGPLGLPDADAAPGEEVALSEAVELFVARAADAVPGFTLDSAGAPAVARLCALLEGIPLAIELAASRLRSLTLAELEVRLDDRLGVLVTSGRTVPARQRTLQRTIEWSYDLLDDQERDLFCRLGVFWVEFPLRAVEIVCADKNLPEASMPPLMERLADKSLVVRVERGDRTWYRLLETVRGFAFRRISADLGEVHERGFLTHLAGRTDRNLTGSVDEMWATLLAGDTEVVRRAMTVAANSFREDEGAEVAGAIAALMSKTRHIALVLGIMPGDAASVDERLDPIAGMRGVMRRFRDGFFAGALRQDPTIEIRERHLSSEVDWPQAFQNPAGAGDSTAAAFADGADIVFHCSGASGHRTFESARRVTQDTGIHRWVIGVDFDEYREVEDYLRPHVLASIRKQVPLDVFRDLKQAVAEGRVDEAPRFGLANGGMAVATSGGHLDHLADALDAVNVEIVGRGGHS